MIVVAGYSVKYFLSAADMRSSMVNDWLQTTHIRLNSTEAVLRGSRACRTCYERML